MSDNTSAPVRSSKASLLIPCVSLALTVAAMAIGGPAALARYAHRPSALEFDASIRYEPVVSIEQGDFRLIAARRVLDQLVSPRLIAFR
ncbi:MAG: hypothetical protein Q8T11_06540 [Elusimicrobiota bacterium]|nr:hypothetical protein [Elusimicrobiota bacterium]